MSDDLPVDAPQTPYQVVLAKCNGKKKRLAEILGIEESGVRKMNVPVNKGGTGGEIRDKHQIILLRDGPKFGVTFTLDDFKMPAAPHKGDGA